MTKQTIRLAAVLGLTAGVGFAGSAAGAKQHTRSFTQTDLGATISTKGAVIQSVYKVKDSLFGSGASVQISTVTDSVFPLRGKDTVTTYFASGVLRTKDTYKLAALDAQGISAITGSGTCIGGTGIHKLEKCSYRITGTYDSKTTIAKVKITGTETG